VPAATLWQALADLVLPASCAGCGRSGDPLRHEVCAACAAAVGSLRAAPTRPDPPPPGLPACVALGAYAGELRELILAFKERGRHRLARPLGALLAEAVAAATPPGAPVLLLYVPDTAAAARARHGDHMRLLARAAAARLREAGRSAAVAAPLRALPKADSAHLTSAQRAAGAAAGFVLRSRGIERVRRTAPGCVTMLLDDIVTTGSTLAAASELLAGAGVRVDGCVTLAATRRIQPQRAIWS
jgi:predicted amidophosphoribosyltransferase